MKKDSVISLENLVYDPMEGVAQVNGSDCLPGL